MPDHDDPGPPTDDGLDGFVEAVREKRKDAPVYPDPPEPEPSPWDTLAERLKHPTNKPLDWPK